MNEANFKCFCSCDSEFPAFVYTPLPTRQFQMGSQYFLSPVVLQFQPLGMQLQLIGGAGGLSMETLVDNKVSSLTNFALLGPQEYRHRDGGYGSPVIRNNAEWQVTEEIIDGDTVTYRAAS